MKEGGFWTVFRETGDPICYVIGKRFEQKSEACLAGSGEARAAACAVSRDDDIRASG
jgi:hypothetical protein